MQTMSWMKGRKSHNRKCNDLWEIWLYEFRVIIAIAYKDLSINQSMLWIQWSQLLTIGKTRILHQWKLNRNRTKQNKQNKTNQKQDTCMQWNMQWSVTGNRMCHRCHQTSSPSFVGLSPLSMLLWLQLALGTAPAERPSCKVVVVGL